MKKQFALKCFLSHYLVTRSPSATTIYRHHTPPKDVQQQPQISTQQNLFGEDSGFVVHKSKGITTLSSMQDPLIPARIRQAKEKTNNDSKAEERGENVCLNNPVIFFFSFL